MTNDQDFSHIARHLTFAAQNDYPREAIVKLRQARSLVAEAELIIEVDRDLKGSTGG